MNNHKGNNLRIMGVALATRGFGFAVLEGRKVLVDWGVKTTGSQESHRVLEKVDILISQYHPGILVLEDLRKSIGRRSPRIQQLNNEVAAHGSAQDLQTIFLSDKNIKQCFFEEGKGTKHALAQILAEQFPEELAFRLPPKRKPWKSEDYRMDIFRAVALVVTFKSQTKSHG